MSASAGSIRNRATLWLAAAAILVALACALSFGPAELVILNNVIVLALFAMATNFLLGNAGLVSFGQAAFYGLGAYTIAMCWFHHWVDFWLAALLAPIVGGLAAFVVGLLALRSRRWFFALLTMAFSQLFTVLTQKGYVYTQGDSGIFGAMVPDALADPRGGSLFILAVAALTMLVLWRITESPLGLILRAIRDDERRVRGLGVDVYWTQLLAVTISGAAAAVAGMLAAVNQQAAYPPMMDWVQSGDAVLVCVIGGMYTFLGPVLGAVVFQLCHDVVVRVTTRWQLILGLVLLIVGMAFPDGVAGLLQPAVWRNARRRARLALATGKRQG